MHTLDIAPLRRESPPPKRSGMARCVLEVYFLIYKKIDTVPVLNFNVITNVVV